MTRKPDPETADLIPTPFVGQTVWWYPKGDTSHEPSAAIVTAIEQEGRVKLNIHIPMGSIRPMANVIYLNHPDKNQRPYIDRYGAFHFLHHQVPKSAYAFHKEREKKREAARKAREEQLERERTELKSQTNAELIEA